jgi:3-methyl-2-oxobutanoate hydroxymethyltransferase
MVPAPLAKEVSAKLSIPTIGIGAGSGTDGQILVWTDFAGLSDRKPSKFVKQYANLNQILSSAAQQYRAEVESGAFPADSNSFTD